MPPSVEQFDSLCKDDDQIGGGDRMGARNDRLGDSPQEGVKPSSDVVNEDDGTVIVSLDKICFTQSSIRQTFHDGVPLATLTQDLISGRVDPLEHPKLILECVQVLQSDTYHSLFNRRLQCLKQCEESVGKNLLARVKVVGTFRNRTTMFRFTDSHTSRNDGAAVRLRPKHVPHTQPARKRHGALADAVRGGKVRFRDRTSLERKRKREAESSSRVRISGKLEGAKAGCDVPVPPWRVKETGKRGREGGVEPGRRGGSASSSINNTCQTRQNRCRKKARREGRRARGGRKVAIKQAMKKRRLAQRR